MSVGEIISDRELRDRALSQYESNRKLPSLPAHTILISEIGDGPNTVLPWTRESVDDALNIFASGADTSSPAGRFNSLAEAVYSKQRPDSITSFTLHSGESSLCLLPSQLPLVDHLLAWVEKNPDFVDLIPTVNRIRTRRLPGVEDVKSVFEITIGESSVHQIQSATEYVCKSKQLECAAGAIDVTSMDTESLSVLWTRVGGFEQLRSNLANNEGNVTFELARRGEGATALPVLLMVGGVHWSLHVRLPISYHQKGNRTEIMISKGSYCLKLEELFRAVGCSFGRGAAHDYHKWILVVTAIWPESQIGTSLCRPLELEWLLRLAGVNTKRSSLFVVWWYTLGIISPKGEVSQGDSKWGLHFHELPLGLQRYLIGETQLVSAAVWVLAACLTFQIFPDMAAIYHMQGYRSYTVFRWMVESAVVPCLQAKNLTCWDKIRNQEHSWSLCKNRKEMIFGIFGTQLSPSSASRLFLQSPTWPAISAGGARYIHSVRHYLACIYPSMTKADPNFWRDIPSSRMTVFTFGHLSESFLHHPSDPTAAESLTANPRAKPTIVVPPEEVSLKLVQTCRKQRTLDSNNQIFQEYTRIHPEWGAALMERIEGTNSERKNVLGRYLLNKDVVEGCRIILEAFHRLRVREPGWVDPYGIERRVNARKEKLCAAGLRKSVVLSKLKATSLHLSERLREAVEEIRPLKVARFDTSAKIYSLLHQRPTSAMSTPKSTPGPSQAPPSEPVLEDISSHSRPVVLRPTGSLPPPPEYDERPSDGESVALGASDPFNDPHVRNSTPRVYIEDNKEIEIEIANELADERAGPSLLAIDGNQWMVVDEWADELSKPMPESVVVSAPEAEEVVWLTDDEDYLAEEIPESAGNSTQAAQEVVELSDDENAALLFPLLTVGPVTNMEYTGPGWAYQVGDLRVDRLLYKEITMAHHAEVVTALQQQPEVFVTRRFGEMISQKDLCAVALPPPLERTVYSGWFNDNVVSYYANLIKHRCDSNPLLPKIYIVSSQTFSKYRIKTDFSKVATGFRKFNPDGIELFIFPIHNIIHWFLGVVDMVQGQVAIYDSLESNSSRARKERFGFATSMKLFMKELLALAGHKKLDVSLFKVYWPTGVPQQTNSMDCGLFTCMAMRAISNRAPFNHDAKDSLFLRQRLMVECVMGRLL